MKRTQPKWPKGFTQAAIADKDPLLAHVEKALAGPKRTATIKEGADGRKWYVWTVEIAVSETWVEDGWELSDDEEATERLQNGILGYARSNEFSVKVTGKPWDTAVAKAQGFTTIKAYRESNK